MVNRHLNPTADMKDAESARCGDLATAHALIFYAAALATRGTPEAHEQTLDHAIRCLMAGSHAGRIGW